MSRASIITLGASVSFTIGIVTYVHLWQKKERERLREGVVLDLERQRRKEANKQEMAAQAQLTAILRQQQDQQEEQSGKVST